VKAFWGGRQVELEIKYRLILNPGEFQNYHIEMGEGEISSLPICVEFERSFHKVDRLERRSQHPTCPYEILYIPSQGEGGLEVRISRS
jgi:hypothetical protein